jgi:hypothetical protein
MNLKRSGSFALNFIIFVYGYRVYKVMWCNWLKLSYKMLLLYHLGILQVINN